MRWIVIGFILLFHLGCKDKDARYLFADTVSLATPMVESTSLFSSPHNRLLATALPSQNQLQVVHKETGKELQTAVLAVPGSYEIRALQEPFQPSDWVSIEILPLGMPVAELEWSSVTTPTYFKKGSTVLTDGKHAPLNFRDSGWIGADKPFQLQIHLHKQTRVDSIVLGVLVDSSAWILPLSTVHLQWDTNAAGQKKITDTIRVSYDETIVKHQFVSIPLGAQTQDLTLDFTPNNLPVYHPGVGHSAWLFLDELIVY